MQKSWLKPLQNRPFLPLLWAITKTYIYSHILTKHVYDPRWLLHNSSNRVAGSSLGHHTALLLLIPLTWSVQTSEMICGDWPTPPPGDGIRYLLLHFDWNCKHYHNVLTFLCLPQIEMHQQLRMLLLIVTTIIYLMLLKKPSFLSRKKKDSSSRRRKKIFVATVN